MTEDIDMEAELFAGGTEHLQRQKTMRAIQNDAEFTIAGQS